MLSGPRQMRTSNNGGSTNLGGNIGIGKRDAKSAISGQLNQSSRGSIPVSRKDLTNDPLKNSLIYRDSDDMLVNHFFDRKSTF